MYGMHIMIILKHLFLQKQLVIKIKLNYIYRDNESTGDEVHVRVIQQPNCTEAIINSGGTKFQVTVERELLAEVVGETKVYIQVHEKKSKKSGHLKMKVLPVHLVHLFHRTATPSSSSL